MEIVKTIIYWLSYTYYIYVFGYASLFKVFRKKSMLDNMQFLGFNQIQTTLIGIGELIGIILIIIGLFNPPYRNIGVLWLFPFAIGAFTAHMAHQEYHHFYNALLMCILGLIMLVLDEKFKIMF